MISLSNSGFILSSFLDAFGVFVTFSQTSIKNYSIPFAMSHVIGVRGC
jgi:hypothetical protein